MAATQRAGRMRGRRILLSQAIRQQNIKQAVMITGLLEEGERKDALLGQRDERIVSLVGDNRRLRLALGHERPLLAVVAPQELEA